MADYYVSAIDYNADGTHIEKLQVHTFDGSGNQKGVKVMTRPEVIGLVKSGKKVATMTKGADTKWHLGAELQVVPVTTEFLKTKQDKSLRDNLENLPTIK